MLLLLLEAASPALWYGPPIAMQAAAAAAANSKEFLPPNVNLDQIPERKERGENFLRFSNFLLEFHLTPPSASL